MTATLDLTRKAAPVGQIEYRAVGASAPTYEGWHTYKFGGYADTLTIASFTMSRPNILVNTTSGRPAFVAVVDNNFLQPTDGDAIYDFIDPWNGLNGGQDVFRIRGGTLTGSGAASSLQTFFKVQRNGAITAGNTTSATSVSYTFQSGANTTAIVSSPSGSTVLAVNSMNNASQSGQINWQSGGSTRWILNSGQSYTPYGAGADTFSFINASLVTVGSVDQAGQWRFGNGSSATQTTSVISSRGSTSPNLGNSFEWGHNNQAGYGCVLGYQTGGGGPFIGFSMESGSTSNTYRTRGFQGVAVYGGTGNGFGISVTPSANADNQAALNNFASMSLTGSWIFGDVGFNATGVSSQSLTLRSTGRASMSLVSKSGATGDGNVITFARDSGGTADWMIGTSGGGSNYIQGSIQGDICVKTFGGGRSILFGLANDESTPPILKLTSAALTHTKSNPNVVLKNTGAVAGSGGAQIQMTDSGDNLSHYISLGASFGSAGNGDMAWATANLGGLAGKLIRVVNRTGGVQLTDGATAWAAISDITQKTVHSNIVQAAAALDGLRTFRFSYKQDGEDAKVHLGMAAQEVMERFPELVVSDQSGILSLNYTGLIPVLVKAIQELKAEISELKGEKNGQ